MPHPSHPGVYIEEVQASLHTIPAIDTSVAAFVGFAVRGPDDRAVALAGFSDYQRTFGGLAADSELSYAVRHFFGNGGRKAIVVRVPKADAVAASLTLLDPAGARALCFTSLGKGAGGNGIVIELSRGAGANRAFSLTVSDPSAGVTETFPSLSLDRSNARYAPRVVNDPDTGSTLVSLTTPDARAGDPVLTSEVCQHVLGRVGTGSPTSFVAGHDGTTLPGTAALIGSEATRTGLYALDRVDLFNVLAIPDATRTAPDNPAVLDSNVDPNAIYSAALAYCQRRRAFLLIDPPPEVDTPAAAEAWRRSGLAVTGKDAAAYFPRLGLADPLAKGRTRRFAPSGVIAGLYARTDANRGIWKAPAGTEATLVGVKGPVYRLNEDDVRQLNPLGLNCIRSLSRVGTVAWGARTLDGADAMTSEWRYIPVRRLALHIEESLVRGSRWVVF